MMKDDRAAALSSSIRLGDRSMLPVGTRLLLTVSEEPYEVVECDETDPVYPMLVCEVREPGTLGWMKWSWLDEVVLLPAEASPLEIMESAVVGQNEVNE